MRLLIRALALLVLLPAVAAAETAYVTDTLQLGLHRAADTSDRPFRSLDSGQELEILSRTTYYANVRLPDGTEGYVKAGFLVSDKPARLIVAETAAERDRIAAELEEARRAFAAPAATIDALRAEAATATNTLPDSGDPESALIRTLSTVKPDDTPLSCRSAGALHSGPPPPDAIFITRTRLWCMGSSSCFLP